MSILNLNRSVLMAPEGVPAAPMGGLDPINGPEGVNAAPPAPEVPAAPPAPVVQPPAPPAAPAPIEMTSEQLADRIQRGQAATLNAVGLDSPEALAALVERDRQATAAAEETRRTQLSTEQQLREDLATRVAERDTAIAESETLRWERHVSGICATLGVRNVEYATFEVERAAEATPEGQEFDVAAWLQERVNPEAEEHSAMRAALGMAAPTVGTQPAPVTTTGAADGNAPPPPAPRGTHTAVDAMDMDPAAWQRHQESLGIG